jgi:hypothetical protein
VRKTSRKFTYNAERDPQLVLDLFQWSENRFLDVSMVETGKLPTTLDVLYRAALGPAAPPLPLPAPDGHALPPPPPPPPAMPLDMHSVTRCDLTCMIIGVFAHPDVAAHGANAGDVPVGVLAASHALPTANPAAAAAAATAVATGHKNTVTLLVWDGTTPGCVDTSLDAGAQRTAFMPAAGALCSPYLAPI